jgi:hypothetical protein
MTYFIVDNVKPISNKIEPIFIKNGFNLHEK